MAYFCPLCANMLLMQPDARNDQQSFFCRTCPYVFAIEGKLQHSVPLKQKQIDDVLGGDEAWANVDATQTECPECSHKKAYFMQKQIRSADEPMTTFYKCCDCGNQWREN
jgi:DNA-directed RNA polymerase III subunit RPC11